MDTALTLATPAPAPLAPSPAALLGAFLAEKLSPATRRAYGADLGAFAGFLGAGPAVTPARLLAAGRLDVGAWVASMRAAGAAPATVARRLAALRCFYAYARACGAPVADPAEGVKAPKVHAREQKAPHLEAPAARRLLGAPDTSTCRGLRDRAILGLLASSGLRRAEVCGLRAGDIEAEAGGLAVTVRGKGGKVRKVAVERATAEALAAYLTAAGRPLGAGDPAAPLFRPAQNPRHGGDCSGPLTVRAVNALVAGYAVRAAVEARGGAVAPHALRRTFATVALDRGATLEELRRTLGHADLRTTARYDRRADSVLTVAY